MHPTIDRVSIIEIDDSVSVSCKISQDKFGIGTSSGKLLIYDGDTLLSSTEMDSNISGIVRIGENLIAATTNGLHAFASRQKWSLGIDSGCDIISASKDNILVADGSGGVIQVHLDGEVTNREVIGDITGLICSNYNEIASISLANGSLLIIDKNVQIIHESVVSDDDTETISCMVFREEGVLLVSRESLGMIIDDRFQNLSLIHI